VRCGPSQLAFTSPEAWQDIYGFDKQRSFTKDPDAYRDSAIGASDMLVTTGAVHKRYRNLIGHAFSDRALREQQPIVESHVDLLMQRLREQALQGEFVDLHKWFNYVTFDVVGDLAFGESFGCLENSVAQPWVEQLYPFLMSSATIGTLDKILPMRAILPWVPRSLLKAFYGHIDMTRDKVERRLKNEIARKDFMHFILRQNDEKGMNQEEIMSNMSLLILAGSETTKTALAGTVYLLLKNPSVLEKLTAEVRSKFTGIDEMTVDRLANFEFLNACIQEGMRLHPPVPVGLPRRAISHDAMVAGAFVPKGTTVTIQAYATNRSPSNFANPTVFDPSRWTSEDIHSTNRLDAVEPFSIGPRNCIGKNLAWVEMRLILTRLLFEFDLELLDDAFNPDRQKVVVLWEASPLNVRLKPVSRSVV
jgi:cytochrome P450